MMMLATSPLPDESLLAQLGNTPRPSVTLVQHGTVVTAAEESPNTDVLIVGEQIAALGRDLLAWTQAANIPVDTCHEAHGCYVIPGGIDPHTHLDMPFMGTTSSDDFYTGHVAALVGGTTSHIDFIMQRHGQSFPDAVAEWHAKAGGKALCDYTFHLAITDFSPERQAELPWVVEEAGLRSFKVFMAYKDALQVDDRQILKLCQLLRAFDASGPTPVVLAHAENGDMVDALTEQLLAEGKTAAKYHAVAHTAIAESEATNRILDLGILGNQPIYVVHMTCHGAVDALERAHARGQTAWGETCIQYLTLDDSLYERPGFEPAKWVFSPPLRSKSDQARLWHALQRQTIATVATDHCPFCMDQKRRGEESFAKIPNGMPGIEHRMELLFSEGVRPGRIGMKDFVRLTSTAAADIFGLSPRKGTLAVGADGDVVIWDPGYEHTLSATTHHMHCDYSAFEGHRVTGKARTVIRRGVTLVDAYQPVATLTPGSGQFLRR
jgi:dihydropyrimidinase